MDTGMEHDGVGGGGGKSLLIYPLFVMVEYLFQQTGQNLVVYEFGSILVDQEVAQ